MASRRSTDPSRPAADRAARPHPGARAPPQAATPLDPQARRELIAIGAYLRAERRGFAPGHAEADWLESEAEVDALLRVSPRGSSQ